jgi:outer membrane protein assembly factor BamA
MPKLVVGLRALRVAVTMAAIVGMARVARADDDESEDSSNKISAPKNDFGIVPLVGGDSDIGFGGGELSSFTRLAPGFKPYVWHLESGALITFRPGSDGVRVPYQDYYLQLVIPQLFGDRMRLEVRPSYTRETTQRYYGIGNASVAPDATGAAPSEQFEYGRMHPTLLVRARLKLVPGLFLEVGNSFTYNTLDIPQGTKLAQDLADPALAKFFGPTKPHAVDFFEQTLIVDTRDDETNPKSGMHHQIKLRLSPGGSGIFLYRYAQTDVILRFYANPGHGRVTVGVRLVGDSQFGDPPFYELARYEDTFALGGGNGVRGVPAQRYYGRVKVFGNFETRVELTKLRLLGKACTLMAAAFFDAGRAWSDWDASRALDGTGLGLKYGVGGGLRLLQGKAFVVRGDIAWSPDAQPIGGYFTAGHIF